MYAQRMFSQKQKIRMMVKGILIGHEKMCGKIKKLYAVSLKLSAARTLWNATIEPTGIQEVDYYIEAFNAFSAEHIQNDVGDVCKLKDVIHYGKGLNFKKSNKRTRKKRFKFVLRAYKNILLNECKTTTKKPLRGFFFFSQLAKRQLYK